MTTPTPKRSESDVYDRQIRLWGAEAQAKISKAKVLYIHITGVSSEILKNLVLAGVHASICDNRPYPSAMKCCPSVLVSEEPAQKKAKYATVAHAMQPVVEDLNPLLGSCEIQESDASDLTEEVIGKFSIVIAARLGVEQAVRISKASIASGGKFFLVDSFGMDGVCVVDLGKDYEYRPEQGKKLLDSAKLQTYVPLEQVLQVPLSKATNRFHKTPPSAWMRYRAILEYHSRTKNWPNAQSKEDFEKVVSDWVKEDSPALDGNQVLAADALKQLACLVSQEIAPVCSVLGGIIGNEVIKVISGKGKPANNTVLFSECKAWTFLVAQ